MLSKAQKLRIEECLHETHKNLKEIAMTTRCKVSFALYSENLDSICVFLHDDDNEQLAQLGSADKIDGWMDNLIWTSTKKDD